ncbi:hypothetical protein B0J13DRAFT_650235 [Dactylonectria estremocensis]|uniref:F-box domain-containing protein n=1 Tax=Dactylonectria estremocensis TaxID=1079267 RepID=A0A9P9FBG1_9HYPO|nr:hypothetical protein B0J13DRAFT_650235 [Dactylonectria estremocensis]
MNPNPPQHLFEGLPFDIHYEVVRYLDFRDAFNMALANRYFQQTLDPRSVLPREDLVKFIGERDKADRNRVEGLFACYKCYRFLPKDKFAKKATVDRKTKRGQAVTDECRRYCFDCAATHRLFDHLQPISNGKLRYYFCHNCRQYKTKSGRCARSCSGIVSVDYAICHRPMPAVQRKSLDLLPTHILKNIVSFLGYDDALHFAMGNRTLKETIQPLKWVALHTRFQFVQYKWTMDTANMDAKILKTFPCYMCCRIRPRTKFTQQQLCLKEKYPVTAWRMRCQECIQRVSIGVENSTKTEHRKRQMCGICKCLKRGRETCGGCLELYVQGAIDHRTMYPKNFLDGNHDYGGLLDGLDGIFDGEDWMEA